MYHEHTHLMKTLVFLCGTLALKLRNKKLTVEKGNKKLLEAQILNKSYQSNKQQLFMSNDKWK